MKYQIEWLNDGPGATGFVGWTPDGIGDDNQFDNEADAIASMSFLKLEAMARGDEDAQYRVVPLVNAQQVVA